MSKKIITHSNGVVETRETFYTEETVMQLKEQLKEKDKEIIHLKDGLNMCKNIKRYDIGEMLTENIKLKQNQTQLAIQELKKLRNDIWELNIGDYYLQNGGMIKNIKVKRKDVCDLIDNQIKELKGE